MGGIISNVLNKKQLVPTKSDFKFGSIIGIGGFGIVREVCRHSDREWFVIKEYNLTALIKAKMSTTNIILNELNSLQIIAKHPFIVKLYAAFTESNSLYFVLDTLSGGDLRLNLQFGEQFSECQVSYVIGCIGLALQHIHRHGIIHRDVKPENIMFNFSGIPKLIDFGISHILTTSVAICSRQSGTKEYFAPEIFSSGHFHSFESDFWSLGIVMYEMLFHKRPQQDTILSNMVLYSSTHYDSIWRIMLDQHQNSPPHQLHTQLQSTQQQQQPSQQSQQQSSQQTHENLPAVTPLTSGRSYFTSDHVYAPTTHTNSNVLSPSSNKSQTKSSIFSPRPAFLDFGHFFSTESNTIPLSTILSATSSYRQPSSPLASSTSASAASSSSPPLDSTLIFTIPDINTRYEPSSECCIDLLLSLLDVRIHKRIGVGNRSDSFRNHKWFVSNGWSHLDQFSTYFSPPFTPNTSKIQCHLTRQYGQLTVERNNQENQENHNSSHHSSTNVANSIHVAAAAASSSSAAVPAAAFVASSGAHSPVHASSPPYSPCSPRSPATNFITNDGNIHNLLGTISYVSPEYFL